MVPLTETGAENKEQARGQWRVQLGFPNGEVVCENVTELPGNSWVCKTRAQEPDMLWGWRSEGH